MTKLRIQAKHLQPGDIMGSGEVVQQVSAGTRTPKGKVDIQLNTRFTQWNKYTMINVERKSKSINEIELEEERKFKD